MAQYFQLINIDKRRTTSYLGKWGQVKNINCDISLWLRVNKIRPLEEILQRTDLFGCRRNGAGQTVSLGLFNAIPVEVILLIFEALPDLESMVIFAITNTRLIQIGYHVLTKELLNVKSFWAYDRIVCIGHRADDPPAGCLSEEDKLSLLKDLPPKGCRKYEYEDDNGKFNLYHVALHGFKSMRPNSTNIFRRALWRRNSPDRDRFFYLLHNLCERSETPVLINTTKKEYIRKTEGREFKTVIPPLVVWGSPDSSDRERGPWAGDRLAITSMDDLESRMKQEEGWKDVIEERSEYQEVNDALRAAIAFLSASTRSVED